VPGKGAPPVKGKGPGKGPGLGPGDGPGKGKGKGGDSNEDYESDKKFFKPPVVMKPLWWNKLIIR